MSYEKNEKSKVSPSTLKKIKGGNKTTHSQSRKGYKNPRANKH